MTGMKEGAGEDPFAEESTSVESDTESRSSETSTEASIAGTDQADDTGEQDSAEHQLMQIPYKLRRNGVQDGRSRVPLFLQKDTKRSERDALREFEKRFDSNVSLTDLREALVKIGLQHPEKVERQLEEWGYGLNFEE
jgi:hypothetical protein